MRELTMPFATRSGYLIHFIALPHMRATGMPAATVRTYAATGIRIRRSTRTKFAALVGEFATKNKSRQGAELIIIIEVIVGKIDIWALGYDLVEQRRNLICLRFGTP